MVRCGVKWGARCGAVCGGVRGGVRGGNRGGRGMGEVARGEMDASLNQLPEGSPMDPGSRIEPASSPSTLISDGWMRGAGRGEGCGEG